MNDEPWRATEEGVVIACRLTPKGGRDAIDGVSRLADGASVLLARVRCAPEDGRANDALCALLAATLGASASRVRLVERRQEPDEAGRSRRRRGDFDRPAARALK